MGTSGGVSEVGCAIHSLPSVVAKGSTAGTPARFFHNSKVSLRVCMMMMWFWSVNFPVTNAGKQCKVAESTAITFFQWFCEICSWKLLQSNIAIGKIFLIDESLFGHQQKVSI